MEQEPETGQTRSSQRAHRHETLAIACGVALALLAVTVIILYLWFS